jgi:hypothetical protein
MKLETTWTGPIWKRWIDTETFENKTLSEFRVTETITKRTSSTTRTEAKQLKEHGESKRKVIENGTEYLRHIQLRDDAVLDNHQVFIEQTTDGRENDRIHFVKGTTESAKSDIQTKEKSIILHVGSVREYLNTAESLSYNIDPITQTPKELTGYLTQLSDAYQKVTA